MSAEKIGQLLWVGFDGHEAPPGLLSRIRRGEAGAAIVFARNVASLDQVEALNASLHAAAPAHAPLLIAVDQEGGRVQRVRAPATIWPPMIRLAEVGDERLAEDVGRAVGTELAALGFDLDFAPVLDVHTNPHNPIIGDRAFGTTPDEVIRLAGAFARGLAGAGIVSCGKHFPGHGDTIKDSHLDLPRIDHPLARLKELELAPFRALSSLPIFMTAHVVFAALDSEVPATLSRRVLTDLLRGELGYQGIIASDDLEMKAIADHYGLDEAIERALLAGCDVFLLCHREDLQLQAMEALLKASERSSEVRTRIDEAAARVADLKRRWPVSRPRSPRSVIGSAEHRALAARLSG